MGDLTEEEAAWLARLRRGVPALGGLHGVIFRLGDRLRELRADLSEARSSGAQRFASDVYRQLVAVGCVAPSGHHGAIEAVGVMLGQVRAPDRARARRLAELGARWREQEGLNVRDLDELARLAEEIGGAFSGVR